ncbi:DUF4292 domain-containing protein [Flammeovirga agarivorans]|uniref:DUF4292 domain-containing protein n=1 Tax=Flammeovirga agarivorans TaxID=2726742 RepID=A0A7X8SPW5_9BACT|nr:DUF4292 domain-containing protein [Flammeovirga agarivorans]NLR94214.1 DUF4292 domain-containing protein [Flammeovirga agarivorans]
MNFKNTLYLSFSIIILISSCAKKNTGVSSDGKASTLDVRNLDYTYLSTKGKLEFDSPQKDLKVAIDTRIEKDKRMWMSMRVAKIEGLRVLATKDSVFALDKLGKEAYTLSYDDVAILLGSKIDYDLLQSIFTGDMPSRIADNAKVRVEEDMFSLTQKNKMLTLLALVGRSNQKLEEIIVNFKKDDKLAVVDYTDFKVLSEESDQIAPHKTNVFIGSGESKEELKKEITVAIDFSKIEIKEEQQKMPFKIPSKYKIIDRSELERRTMR